jgi:hypothetical protein
MRPPGIVSTAFTAFQALPPGKEGERCLLLWGVEDAVKARYAQYVQLLERCSTDNIDFVKERATKTIFRMLVAKPEGEQVRLKRRPQDFPIEKKLGILTKPAPIPGGNQKLSTGFVRKEKF